MDRTTRRSAVPTPLIALLSALLLLATGIAPTTASDDVRVIVRGLPGAAQAVQSAVEAVSGTVTHRIGLIDGVVADVPTSAVASLNEAPGVHSVTEDSSLVVQGKPSKDATQSDSSTTGCTASKRANTYFSATSYCATDDPYSMTSMVRYTKAKNVWNLGYTGKGVDVAVIDTGVNEEKGLKGKVLYGADVSFDGWDPDFSSKDKHGHGTHLASIIAGRDEGVPVGAEADYAATHFLGIAPGARIVSVKAGDRNGVVDVSQILAALDWTVQNRSLDGANIRVINLAFGTNGTQSYLLDPLTYAVEVAWRKGIVVVTSAGNSGHSDGRLVNPAYDPLVIAVGAADTKGSFSIDDDVIPSWSSRGDGVRNPDVVAPGRSVAAILSSNSKAKETAPGSILADGRLIRGSGTSQSAAVVSGVVALILEKHPNATPDQVKALLRGTARPLPAADVRAQGRGLVDALAAIDAPLPSPLTSTQLVTLASGTGSLEGARGDVHVTSVDGVDLVGEVTVNGSTWAGSTWAGSTWAGSTWAGSTWAGSTWAGSTWAGGSWNGSTWAGSTWAGSTWAGSTWAGSTWAGSTWAGEGWLGVRWE